MCTFSKVIEKLNSQKFSNKERGSIFEKLMKNHFLKDPKYSVLENVCLWDEFPFKREVSKSYCCK